jgi:hypothetical protein
LAEAEIAITRVHDVLAKRVSAAANAKAVMEGECQLSNHELHERVDAVSRYLLSAGVRPGDRVATLAPPGIDFWVTFLAATSVGATALLPQYADDILGGGPMLYGVLRAAPYVGALIMAGWLAFRPNFRNAGHALLGSVAVFAVATIVFG